jgi:hypothetical protein
MPTLGPDGWTVEFTEAEIAQMEATKKAWADSVLANIQPDGKLIIESSNETMHLDPETGEWVSDSYVEEVWNSPEPPAANWPG